MKLAQSCTTITVLSLLWFGSVTAEESRSLDVEHRSEKAGGVTLLVTDYGAVPDGTTLNTKAIQKATGLLSPPLWPSISSPYVLVTLPCPCTPGSCDAENT